MFPAMRQDGSAIRRAAALEISVLAAALSCAVTAGCSKKDDSPAAGSSAGASPGGGPAPVGSAAVAARARPVKMTAEPEKVWAAAVSLGTGLTPMELDSGRAAVGAMSSRGPTVVVFDSKGEGQEARIRVKKELTSELKKDEKREVLRVTPALGSGSEVIAFVDYREVGDARRLVACGPSDSSEEILKFDGKPILDAGDETPAKTDEAAKSAAPAPSAKPAAPAKPPAAPSAAKPAPAKPAPLPSGAKPAPAPPSSGAAPRKPPALGGVAAKPGSSAKPAAPPAPAPAKPPPSGKTEPERELRECRTLVDRGGAHAWAVGTELVGKPAADGTADYSVVLFAEQERGRGRSDLSSSPLGKAPAKVPVYEAATAYDMGGGSFVLAARFRGALFSWVLDASKHPRGMARVYSGGYPAQPHFVNFGTEIGLVVVQTGTGGQKSARAARFTADVMALPSALSDLVIPERSVEPPVSAAMFGAASPFASSRFVAYQADETARRLSIVQVDGNLAPAGEPLTIDLGVRESELFALDGGKLLVVYIRVDASGKSELVSKTIRIG
jgi:hypothetical protein